MAKGKSSTGKHKASSGMAKAIRIKNTMRAIERKIARWERYKEDGKASITAEQNKNRNRPNKSRHRNWDTTGLKKHLELLNLL